MNERVQKLRQQSLDARPVISLERAQLLTEFYKSPIAQRVSIPVARAMALKHILEHKKICINDGELIVGERGPAPKATPTYPEICTHTLKDLDILNSREKVSFGVDDETRRIQKDTIIPFWSEQSIRDRIFKEVDPEWVDAYEAGVFTEFMEQRAPGHTVLDDKIYHKGFTDFKTDIDDSIRNLDFFNDPQALAKREELKAMSVAADLLCFTLNVMPRSSKN
jgi:pyruvate-formate lyase